MPKISYVTDFYTENESKAMLKHFLHEHLWPDNHYTYAGRQFILPRLQTWHADPGIRYSYSNNLLITRAWTPLLLDIRRKVENYLSTAFNAVLVNYYRDGQDYVGWHADDEPELGDQPLIASISFGAERQFCFKLKQGNRQDQCLLTNGSLLIMQPEFQQLWLHSIPRNASINEARINLTFRRVMM